MKKILVVICLCLLWSGVSYAECAEKVPFVHVSFRKSAPKYYSKPAKDVQAACTKSSYVPVGCTWHKMSYKYKYRTSGQKKCNQITNVDMNLFYKKGDFYVYIDNKYPKDSCEYNAIKKHEDMHVKIDQTVRKKKIKKKLEECILEFNKKGVDAKDANSAVDSCVREAFDLDEQARREKNQKLDADETRQPGGLDKTCKWKK